MKFFYVLLLTGFLCKCQAVFEAPSILASISEDFNNFLAESQEDSDEVINFEDSMSSNSDAADCNVTLFNTCNAALGKDLNITTPIRSAMDFVKFLRKVIYKEGQEGLKRLCKAFVNHSKCLGSSFSKCVNVENFEKLGVKPRDAYTYVTILYEFKYECSPAALKEYNLSFVESIFTESVKNEKCVKNSVFKNIRNCIHHISVILDNWKCIGSVEKRSRDHFRKCVVDFVKGVKKQPANACPLAQKMVMCIDFPFGKSCNQSVVTVMCNIIKAGLTVSLPKCTINCPKNAAVESDNSESEPELQNLAPVQEYPDPAEMIDLPVANNDEVQFVRQSGISTDESPSVFSSPLSKDILQVVKDQADAQCDDPKFQNAIDHFAQLFGFQKLPKNSVEFITSVKSYMERQKKHGFKKVCDAGKELYRRLGKDQFNMCITQENFETMGYSKNDAFVYMDLSAQLFYECGEGYPVYFENFDCIVKTGQEKADDLKKCGTDFQQNVTSDPTHVCECCLCEVGSSCCLIHRTCLHMISSFAQSLLKCVEKPYGDGCGDDVAKAICNTGKIQLKHVLPKCKSITCSQRSVGRIPLRGVKIRKNNQRRDRDDTDIENPDVHFDIFQNNV